MTAALTPSGMSAARVALMRCIDEDRAQLRYFAARRSALALHWATEIAHAEHAYRALGGTVDAYLPATARTPPYEVPAEPVPWTPRGACGAGGPARA